MGNFAELLAVDSKETLRIFYNHLFEIRPSGSNKVETLYAASILATFAQVSTECQNDYPAPKNLSDVFDAHCLLPTEGFSGPEHFEVAGSQTLFIVWVFGDQMKRCHSLAYFCQQGQGFYLRAASLFEEDKRHKKSELLNRISMRFTGWATAFNRLRRETQDSYYLLNLPPPEPPTLPIIL